MLSYTEDLHKSVERWSLAVSFDLLLFEIVLLLDLILVVTGAGELMLIPKGRLGAYSSSH